MAAPIRAFIKVDEGQDIDQAMYQLRKRMQQEYGRPWCKRRYGYYESKGALGRKRKKMGKLRGGGPAFFQRHALKLHVGYVELFERTGPEMAAGPKARRPGNHCTRHQQPPCPAQIRDAVQATVADERWR